MNTVNVAGWHIDPATKDKADKAEQIGQEEVKERLEQELPPWPSPDGEHIVEDTSLLFSSPKQVQKEGEPTHDSVADAASDHENAVPPATALTVSARRSYFSKEQNLKDHRYRPDQVYGFDFFNPYLDFANFTLNVPGFSVDITRYWDGQVRWCLASSFAKEDDQWTKTNGTLFSPPNLNIATYVHDQGTGQLGRLYGVPVRVTSAGGHRHRIVRT